MAHLDNQGALSLGRDIVIQSSPVRPTVHVGRGGRLRIGDRVYLGQGANLTARLAIDIGDDVRIGSFAMIVDTDFHSARDRRVDARPEPIVIGARAVIGAHAVILRGVRVGEDAVVEPGSVVMGRIAPGVRVAGNPARPVSESPRGGPDRSAGV